MPNRLAISSLGIGCIPIPKDILRISLSLYESFAKIVSIPLDRSFLVASLSAGVAPSSGIISRRQLTSSSFKGLSKETALPADAIVLLILLASILVSSSSSSREGFLPFSCSNFSVALFILLMYTT